MSMNSRGMGMFWISSSLNALVTWALDASIKGAAEMTTTVSSMPARSRSISTVAVLPTLMRTRYWAVRKPDSEARRRYSPGLIPRNRYTPLALLKPVTDCWMSPSPSSVTATPGSRTPSVSTVVPSTIPVA